MIKYRITPLSISEHLFAVSMVVSAGDRHTVTLSLPSWIPGSYMIRDFAKNLIGLNCANKEVIVTQLDKQTWRVQQSRGLPLGDIQLDYQVFAFDLSVRAAYINDEYAFFNGTSVFLKVVEFEHTEHHVCVDKSHLKSWEKLANAIEIITSMPCVDNSNTTAQTRHFLCSDYLTMVDHPVVIGQFTRASFELDGVTFHAVFTGNHKLNLARICKDLQPICKHHISLFSEIPVSEYWFITLLCKNGFGGLEHTASTILQYAYDALPKPNENDGMEEGYRDFLSLCSHELFHTWHVKRNKPDVYLSPDLSQEVYSPQLWIYEGFTSLYDDLTLARTGLITPEEYCKIVGQNITRLLRNPGRHKQSIEESSFNAWTKFYKQDANSVNHIVSYYLKGGIAALAIDIKIRQLSQQQYNLDHVMQAIWNQFGSKNIGTPDEVIKTICQDTLGLDLSAFIDLTSKTTQDLPLSELLQTIGLSMHLRSRTGNDDKGGIESSGESTRDFGALLNDQTIGCKVTQILDGRAASLAGLQLNDHIIALNGLEVNAKSLMRELNTMDVGTEAQIHILRDGRLLCLSLPVIEAEKDTCYLSINDQSMFAKWLGIA
ncbi:M61 family metallopeptidase [Agaribacter flavus]|uniref:M61 family metallopeptidase n=1 Tax=Agaribacter flavus TaxID=1902781 RepID=A0ABV7FL34_9ALTE